LNVQYIKLILDHRTALQDACSTCSEEDGSDDQYRQEHGLLHQVPSLKE